jgi:hexosaminidase
VRPANVSPSSSETLKQLFYAHSSGSGTYTPYAPLRIQDSPRFSHRGLSLDIARNPFTIDDAMRTIDAMATTKMNRLHLHATDSQSWPLEIPSLPELAAKGAYQPDLVWTVNDLEAVQSYGDYRGVMVYVEIDMPGHTASVAQGYSDLVAAYNELDWSTFAAEPLSGQLKLNSSKVTDFLDTLFADLLPRLRTHSGMYHLGGDEVNRKVHVLDETVRSDDFDTLKPLIQQVFDQIFEHVISHGLRPVVWEEMVLDWDLELPPNFRRTLVQVWRSSENIEQVLRKGHPVIFGDYHHWYLDCGFGQFLDPYESGRSPPGVPFNSSGGQRSRLQPPYLDYCNPFHNWRDIYAFDPLANISAELHYLVEGGEVLMWSEQTDSSDLDFKLWPRAAAAAEVLWNGPASPHPLATWRLGHWRERLVVDRGIGASPVTMTWCLMEGGCEY